MHRRAANCCASWAKRSGQSICSWEVGDRETGRPRARITMKAGDVAAMPADIRHQGFSKKRSMLLVWENVTAVRASAATI